MLETTTGFFGWPLADGIAAGLARYRQKYGGDPPAIWLRTPTADHLGAIPICTDALVPVDAVYFGPVPLAMAAPPGPDPAGYAQEVLL